MNNKSERDKAKAGELYDANFDPELFADRIACKDLCHRYNALAPSQLSERATVIGQLFAKVGKNCFIEQSFYCDYGYNIEIGDNFFANHNLVVLDAAKVTIGNNVFIAPNCGIYTATHPLDVARRNRGLEYARPICIGNNVWIGGGVTLLPGVTIGDNVVVGAGSVVTHDVEPSVVVAGNPARTIRHLTSEQVEAGWRLRV